MAGTQRTSRSGPTEPAVRADRLTELVTQLTGCPQPGVRQLVGSVGGPPTSADEALRLAARALVELGRPTMRVAPYLDNAVGARSQVPRHLPRTDRFQPRRRQMAHQQLAPGSPPVT